MFDKNLLFNGKSIRKEKGTVKENKIIGRKESGQTGSSDENGTFQGWTLQIAY